MLCSALFAETKDCEWIRDHLDTIPDFPKEGINFQSICPLLRNPQAFKRVTKEFANRYTDRKLDAIVGLESRGFVFGTALAYELDLPFVMIRKKGRLPSKVVSVDYALEYGSATFELEIDSFAAGSRVLIIDDLMATGGTAQAACDLVEMIGSVVDEVAVVVELHGLNGRTKVKPPVYSLISFDVY
ncbi:MAG: adenine phosphoribosyltransferase [Chlamydiales bacterium]|nr:adenine phosphoribosyltransferase [Chlamydiales bacterium]